MEFLPLAEESGDTIRIGRWVLSQVCKHIQRWSGLPGERYTSVNLSAEEFSGEGRMEYIDRVLRSEEVPPARLKLETAETQSRMDIEDAIGKIRRLKDIGVDVYIDDFGAGYSSLAYLKRLPAGVIKIDKCFVDNVAEDEEERAFLAGMIGMIVSKDKRIVVEGVATREQRDILAGLERMQGFYFRNTLPAPDFEVLLRRREPLLGKDKAAPLEPPPSNAVDRLFRF